jgi:hypothetical protein
MAKNGKPGHGDNGRHRPRLEELEARTLLSASPVVQPPAWVEGQRGTLPQLHGLQVTDSTPITVRWGDGTRPQTVHAHHGRLTLRHTYAEEGDYQYAVTVGQATRPLAHGVLHVQDAALTLRGVEAASDVRVGSQWSGKVASFKDANPGASAADFTATIRWGDGTTSQGTVVPDTAAGHAGRFSVLGTHTYTQVGAGSYNVSVTVQDKGGSTAGPVVSRFAVRPAPALNGVLGGKYTQASMNPDMGTAFDLTNGQGSLAVVGRVTAAGTVRAPGNVLGGKAGGTLTLTTGSHETITLQLTDGASSAGHLHYHFDYKVTGVTEADKSHPADPNHLLNGTGTMDVDFVLNKLGAAVVVTGGSFTLALHPTVG